MLELTYQPGLAISWGTQNRHEEVKELYKDYLPWSYQNYMEILQKNKAFSKVLNDEKGLVGEATYLVHSDRIHIHCLRAKTTKQYGYLLRHFLVSKVVACHPRNVLISVWERDDRLLEILEACSFEVFQVNRMGLEGWYFDDLEIQMIWRNPLCKKQE